MRVAWLIPLLLLMPASVRADTRFLDEVQMFKPASAKAAESSLADIARVVGVEFHIHAVAAPAKDVPADKQLAALETLARTRLAKHRGQAGLVVLCPAWKKAAVVANEPMLGALQVAGKPGKTHPANQVLPDLLARYQDIAEDNAPEVLLTPALERTIRPLLWCKYPNLTILDNGRLFKPETISYVAEKLAKVVTQPKLYPHPEWKFCVETAETVSAIHKTALPKKTRERDAALRQLTDDRADEAREQGIFREALFVLIIRDLDGATSPDVRVVGWPREMQTRFDRWSNRRNLVRKEFQRSLPVNRDKALQDAVNDYLGYMEQRQSPVEVFPALVLVLSLVAAWLLARIVRMRLLADHASKPLYPPAMQGCLFGAPSAYWVYDRLFASEAPPPSAADPEPPPPTEPTTAAPPEEGLMS